MSRVAALLAIPLIVACASAGASRPDAPDPVDTFRRDLADPAQYRFRDGLAIDPGAIRDAIRDFGDENRDLIAARLEESVASLAPGEPPSEDTHERLTASDDTLMVDVGPVVALFENLYPDVRGAVRRTLSTALPVLMTADVGIPPDLAGLWLGFVATAEPAWRRCGLTERRLTVCADYGGADVFVVEFVRADVLWTPSRLAWWQRRSDVGG